MTNKKFALTLLFTIFSTMPALAQTNEQGYWDFKSQKMVSKEEFDKDQDRLSACSDEATRRVKARIADGSIPMTSDASNNADWQRAFHSEYVRRCLNRK
ncbi:hypothetical protein QM543_07490 [Pantoea eucrina]|uniref:hypothetical protein n=1 Tax=Pantoea eucrina TaxID=472693 RepID=UPI0024B6E182|nr:hypothetical protein [Pantoea eucrina]MDJ0023125.1 hypothetical protein [Pantoea eucrina]